MKKVMLLIIMCTITSSFIAIAQEYGDVNEDTVIDIVDSLLVAQEYVGLSPINFKKEWSDVNEDSLCDIVDALLISQYYVGLISWFPRRTPTPPSIETIVPTGEPTPGPTKPPVFPREIEEFVNRLKTEFTSMYIIEVEQSMLEIYPPRFIVSISINPDLDIAYRMGMLDSTRFNIWVEEETRTVNVELSGLTADYFGIDPRPEGQLLIEGLMILADVKEATPAVLGMMSKIVLYNYYSDGTIYIEYNNVYFKIYRNSSGQVQVETDFPPIVKNFVTKLQREIGNTYMVEIYNIYFFVPPEFPTWGVKVESIIDFQRPGELYSMDFHIRDQGGTIVVVSPVLSVNYAEIEPQPPGELLYDGIVLWLRQYPTFAPVEAFPISLLTQIIINRVDPKPVIYFTDPMGAKWMIYLEDERVILRPVE
ncbi:MAG: hypothetical protein JXJ04_23765 [Spirochaetales bacterium]|nr:hypothetical protein [Spirochaetales bacterium]